MSEPQWEDVAKARSMAEANAEDAVLDFLRSEGWIDNPHDDNRFTHPQKSPGVWLTLGEAFELEQRSST